ncbi:ATP-binding protein [Thioalkalivibrio sp.]|uniref:ATP-binding protein n=1 Tax=Thioalkalivibrio sp. TaxID=2093813 RepID=UPI003974B35F
MIPDISRQASAFILSQPLPPYRRFLHDRIDFNERLIGIKGARGSGKTTLILQYARQGTIPLEKILYVACDHPAMAGRSIYELAQTFYQEGGKLLLIDEVHKAKGFARGQPWWRRWPTRRPARMS